MKSIPSACRAGHLSCCLLSVFLVACAGFGTGDPVDARLSDPAVQADAPGTGRHDRLVLQATGARAADEGDDDSETAVALPDVDLTPQLLFQLLASEVAAQRGQLASATSTYQRMAEETRDPRLARRATELALANRALDRALPSARLWYELSPDSIQATRTLETLLLSTGDLQGAEPLIIKRLAQARSENKLAEFYRQTERSLSRASDKKAALALLDRVAAGDQQLTEARLALAATANAAGDQPRAVAEAQAAVRIDPANELTAITAARFAQDGPEGPQPGIAILESFLSRKPKAIEARFAYARLLAADNRKDEAREQFEVALKQEPDSPAILYSLAQLAYQTDQKDLAADYLGRYVGLPETVQRDNNPAYLFLGQIAEEKKRLPDAIGHYAKVSQGEQYLDARIRRAILLGKTGQLDDGRALLRTTSVGSQRERDRLTSAEAELLRSAGRHDEAFKLLDEALVKQPDSTDMLYDHAMAAERLDRIDVMEKSLRKLIALNPASAHGYNALGYTFADRNIKLEEAQELITKALELSPDDAHILDSMGWVLFRRGDLAGAERYLRKAFDKAPEAEVATHLGEVLFAAGRQAEARDLWARARAIDPDNPVLKSTLARLHIDL